VGAEAGGGAGSEEDVGGHFWGWVDVFLLVLVVVVSVDLTVLFVS
jgi:hypothetical protein